MQRLTRAVLGPAGHGAVHPRRRSHKAAVRVDVRAERQFTFGSRLRLMFDAFNLTNSHASETIGRATGISYQKPSAILAPRTARVGFRVLF